MRKPKISPVLVVALGSALMVVFMPLVVCGAMINGTITGSTVSGPGPNFTDTSTTINMSYFTSCYFITNGIAAQNFGGMNFVFAGQGAASGISSISPSDFTISQYAPWVVNNNNTTNNITGPGVVGGTAVNSNRGVTNQDDGGCDIVISYTPGMGDPTSVNFMQAYIDSINGGAFTTGTIDNNNTAGKPFYNQVFAAGTGTTPRSGTSPLVSAANTAAWELDIPYTPELGDPATVAPGYVPGSPITSETVTFQTFISSQQVIAGTTYNVLYGGVQWGYSFSVPEPSSLLLVVATFGAASLRRRRRQPANQC